MERISSLSWTSAADAASICAHFGPGSLGLDAVEANVEAVRARGLDAQLANVEDALPELDRQWDAAYCSNIIEHLVAPHLLLLRLHEVLTPNGLIFVMVPTVPPARPLDWLIRRVIGHNGYRAAEHIYAFTPRTAEFMVERAGYRVIETAFVAARSGSTTAATRADLQGDWHLRAGRRTPRSVLRLS